MLNFIKKIILFLFPLGLIFVFPLVVYYFGREYYSTEQIIAAQTTKPGVIYGTGYTSAEAFYKQQLLARIDPEVLVLGASRSAEFRREFFSRPTKFFNAGCTSQHGAGNLATFLKNLPVGDHVKLIILSLDPIEFVAGSPRLNRENSKADDPFWRLTNFLAGGWRKVYVDYFVHKFTLSELINKAKTTGNVGVQAIINNDGYRADGSYQYAKAESDSNHRQDLAAAVNLQLDSAKNHGDSPEYGRVVATDTLDSLVASLKLCQEKNIYVIGLFSPHPAEIFQKISSPDYPYRDMVESLPVKLSKIFSDAGFSFYDLSDLRTVGANNSEFLDWIHGTDKLDLRVMIYLAEKNQQLKKYVNLDNLKAMLKNSPGDFLILN